MNPITKKDMTQISKILSIAALFAVGALAVGCYGLKAELEVPGTEPSLEKTITVTSTVGLKASTKALTAAGVKTFAADETIAVFYTNTSDALVKTTYTFTAGDLIDGGRKASITVSMTAPKAGGAVKYIYPDAMANADGTVNYAALATQDGTLTTLAANFDLATYDGTLTGEAALPASVTLCNQLAILELNITDGSSDITGSIRQLIVKNGANTFTVNRTPAVGPVYVAMQPVTSGTIIFEAAKGKALYTKTVSGKTLGAGEIYPVTLSTSQVPGLLSGLFTIDAEGHQVRFAQGNLQAYFASAGTAHTWRFAENQYDRVDAAHANVAVNGSGSVSHAGAVDLFGWVGASSSYNNYGINSSMIPGDYGNTANEALKSDWGTLAITNGGNATNSGWRTLTKDQWQYLFSGRTNYLHLYGMGSISVGDGTVNGIIVLPDGCPLALNFYHNAWANNELSMSTWTDTYETAGAIFLPLTGKRDGTSVEQNSSCGYYWSSTAYSSNDRAFCVYFYNTCLYPANDKPRYIGHAVRLVKDAN